MKAVMYERYGPPEVLQLQEIAKPVPGEKEVLIRIYATPVEYGDLTARNFRAVTARSFNMPLLLLLPSRLAFGVRRPRIRILGSAFSGVVEATGSGVSRFKVGDELFGYRGMRMGANAEYLCMPEGGTVALKPAALSHAEAAAR
jgi:NADPH:quinone reductase-like Zn-dependent oxidoreductase